jgi:NCS1 family nucleobase:cation symporter-1
MVKYVDKYIPSKETLKARATTVKAWQLPKQTSTLAPSHIWTNKVGSTYFHVQALN